MNSAFLSRLRSASTGGVPACWVLAALLVGGCAAGPDYQRPALDVPAAYKEAGPWKSAEPRPAASDSSWWQAYDEPALDQLVEQANAANQSIEEAAARYRQARALAAAARAGLWPTLSAGGGLARARTNASGLKLGNQVQLGLDAGWEPDLWGGTRRAVEAGEAGAEASAADLAAARLAVQATLAQDYLQLRMTDLLADLYARTTAAYRRALQLTQSQYAAGVALRADVALAESQLAAAEAQAIDLQAQRSQLEHAIAVLLGRAPAAFALPVQTALPPVPAIPAGLPSALLERRPDIASAERLAAQANANIGVARAAWFPSLTLAASAGFDAPGFAQWFDVPSQVWSLGASLAQTMFDGGLRRARDRQARAAYDAATAHYKQTVLAGFQEVEDNLAALRVLEQEIAAQQRAATAAQLAERLALAQYRGGTATYLAVVTAQTRALDDQQALVRLRGRQLVASVALIKALGGGWSALPAPQARAD